MSRWNEIYSPKLNQGKIEKLFRKFGLNNYNFANNGYDDYDVYITNGLYTYKATLNSRKEELILYRESIFRNQKSHREFHTPCYTVHNDVWYKTVKYILK